MRIISGRAGGIRLSAPAGRSLRPTEDRVKESMFSTLGDLTGATVIDLFAGTGALGLEALSRGADRVFLVENNREHCQYITRNLAAVLKALGNPTRADAGTARVITADARQAATVLADIRPDVLLADASLAAWAGPECLLVLEHAADAILPWHPQSPWRLLKDKRFGIRAVSFARLAQ